MVDLITLGILIGIIIYLCLKKKRKILYHTTLPSKSIHIIRDGFRFGRNKTVDFLRSYEESIHLGAIWPILPTQKTMHTGSVILTCQVYLGKIKRYTTAEDKKRLIDEDLDIDSIFGHHFGTALPYDYQNGYIEYCTKNTSGIKVIEATFFNARISGDINAPNLMIKLFNSIINTNANINVRGIIDMTTRSNNFESWIWNMLKLWMWNIILIIKRVESGICYPYF